MRIPGPVILAAWDTAILAIIAALLLWRHRADRRAREAADFAAELAGLYAQEESCGD
jgi:hypothetical protein